MPELMAAVGHGQRIGPCRNVITGKYRRQFGSAAAVQFNTQFCGQAVVKADQCRIRHRRWQHTCEALCGQAGVGVVERNPDGRRHGTLVVAEQNSRIFRSPVFAQCHLPSLRFVAASEYAKMPVFWPGSLAMTSKRIFVIYTGGTLGMQPTPRGYQPLAGWLEQQLRQLPELQQPEMPEFVLHEYAPLLDSSDMQPADWQTIAADIHAHYDDYDGFVVLHGTDTMAYSAAAVQC